MSDIDVSSKKSSLISDFHFGSQIAGSYAELLGEYFYVCNSALTSIIRHVYFGEPHNNL